MKTKLKKLFFIILGILIVGGFWCLISASNIVGRDKHGDSFYFVKDQAIKGLIIGVIVFFILSKINIKLLRKFSFLFYIFNILLLGMVFLPMFSPKGNISANRWVEIFGVSFQPAELLKFTLILFIADFLSRRSPYELNNWKKTIVPLIVLVGIPMVLIFKQPATSIIVLFLIAVGAMCFASKISLKTLLPIGVLVVALLGLSVLFGGNYRKARITHEDDYQKRQSITGIVRGGLSGVGFGQSIQKYNYLPQSYTDSIYAVIAEEFGFAGTALVLTTYFFLCFCGFYIAMHTSDSFSSLFVIGTITWITVQALIHIMCMSINYMPVTGLPLPLISYGGTSYAITLASLGVVYNVLKNKV